LARITFLIIVFIVASFAQAGDEFLVEFNDFHGSNRSLLCLYVTFFASVWRAPVIAENSHAEHTF
jgi:hypothetical protein